MGDAAPLKGPDFSKGVSETTVVEGTPLLGQAFGEAVLLVRDGQALFGIGATCTHYSGPLAEGIQVGCTVRCPWHHARFDARTGAAVGAPALSPVACYELVREGGQVRVVGKKDVPAPKAVTQPDSVVIVGGGAAGNAAAETLRAEGFAGAITMLSADESVPVDRPNLSKDFLAGGAPEEWIPLRGREFYDEKKIHLRTNTRVAGINVNKRTVQLQDGTSISYGALVLATGAEPIQLTIPGADLPHVHVLRTLADCRKIIATAGKAKRALVLGSSFIGLEVAASLRKRGLEVDVVTRDKVPFEKILGAEVGTMMKKLHETNGVTFHAETSVARIETEAAVLENGKRVLAELVVVGIGVRPALTLAETAGLSVDRGVKVNEFLQTSAPDVWAAGDIARFPDARGNDSLRIEHWVVAERQGQTVALNILGKREPFRQAPFFWTTQYDVSLSYVGHAEGFAKVEIDGSLENRDATVRYKKAGKVLAVLTLNRDVESLRAEVEMEQA